MRPGLMIGEPHVVCYTVPADQTVPGLLPALDEFRRGQPVFATGFMVGLMEAPCMAAVYPHLEPGEATVGTLINMDHLVASPPGTSLVAEARAIAIDGRSVRFAVVVSDAAGDVVAAGEHTLRVIVVARFHDRLTTKRTQLDRAGSSQLPCECQQRGRQISQELAIPRGDDDRARSHNPGRRAEPALDRDSRSEGGRPRRQRRRSSRAAARSTAAARTKP